MLHSDPLSRVNWPLNGARVTRVGTRAANELSQSQRSPADTDAIIIRWVKVPLAWCLNTVLNVKTLVCAFNQEKDFENHWIVCSSIKRIYLQCVHNSGNVQS